MSFKFYCDFQMESKYTVSLTLFFLWGGLEVVGYWKYRVRGFVEELCEVWCKVRDRGCVIQGLRMRGTRVRIREESLKREVLIPQRRVLLKN